MTKLSELLSIIYKKKMSLNVLVLDFKKKVYTHFYLTKKITILPSWWSFFDIIQGSYMISYCPYLIS